MSHDVLETGTFTTLAGRPNANTRLGYLYRDADNYKQTRDVVFPGALTVAQAKALLAALDEDDGFVPSAVGLTDLQEQMSTDWDPESDHPYHEIASLALTLEPATETMPVADFLEEFTDQDWAAAAATVEARMSLE